MRAWLRHTSARSRVGVAWLSGYPWCRRRSVGRKRLRHSTPSNDDSFTEEGRVLCPMETGDIYLPGANASDSQWASVEAAPQWVVRQLEALGVQLTVAA